MTPLTFKDPIVAERFVSLVEKDRMVEQPRTYRGLFSNITPAMAYMMVRKKSNIIALKKVAEPQEPAKD